MLEPGRAAHDRGRRRGAVARACGACAAVLLLPACSHLPDAWQWPTGGRRDAKGSYSPSQDSAIYRAADQERLLRLEREVKRLRADLRQAEEAMIALESGLRDAHSRADAVSAVAEARIAVAPAHRAATWRPDQLQEARAKLAEAERQLEAGHTSSAVFFATRARRIAGSLNEEADRVASSTATRFVRGGRANLRAGPSTAEPVVDVLPAATPVFPEREHGPWVLVKTIAGSAGWVHASLLREP